MAVVVALPAGVGAVAPLLLSQQGQLVELALLLLLHPVEGYLFLASVVAGSSLCLLQPSLEALPFQEAPALQQLVQAHTGRCKRVSSPAAN